MTSGMKQVYDAINRQITQFEQGKTSEENEALQELLGHHYGDGSVYLPRGIPANLVTKAKEQGLIDEEGYLTRDGRQYLAIHDE